MQTAIDTKVIGLTANGTIEEGVFENDYFVGPEFLSLPKNLSEILRKHDNFVKSEQTKTIYLDLDTDILDLKGS